MLPYSLAELRRALTVLHAVFLPTWFLIQPCLGVAILLS